LNVVQYIFTTNPQKADQLHKDGGSRGNKTDEKSDVWQRGPGMIRQKLIQR